MPAVTTERGKHFEYSREAISLRWQIWSELELNLSVSSDTSSNTWPSLSHSRQLPCYLLWHHTAHPLHLRVTWLLSLFRFSPFLLANSIPTIFPSMLYFLPSQLLLKIFFPKKSSSPVRLSINNILYQNFLQQISKLLPLKIFNNTTYPHSFHFIFSTAYEHTSTFFEAILLLSFHSWSTPILQLKSLHFTVNINRYQHPLFYVLYIFYCLFL